MYFPWIGFLEQLNLCDVFVRYDDVQFSKGSFANRVQIKMNAGTQWLTVPLQKHQLETAIRNVTLNESRDWRREHIERLSQAYRDAPFRGDALRLVEETLSPRDRTLAPLAWRSVDVLCRYFGIAERHSTIEIGDVGAPGRGSERVLRVVKAVGGSVYITGHGARQYLAHEEFERSGVSVEYMDYQRLEYPQQFGSFTPYVSALDLVANCGVNGRKYICSPSRNWRHFTNWISSDSPQVKTN
jgi:hypothetical protein